MNWIDKYAPKTIEDIIFPRSPAVKRIINNLFTQGIVPCRGILLYDQVCSGGTSKSTLLDLFVSTTGIASLKIPTEGSTKEHLEEFKYSLAAARSLSSVIHCAPQVENKVAVLGPEISKSSTNFIDGLRDFVDDNKDSVLWLFSDNDFGSLKTRCPQMFNNQRILSLNWDLIDPEDVRSRCIDILQMEGKNTSYNRAILETALTTHGPSIRGVLNELEVFHV